MHPLTAFLLLPALATFASGLSNGIEVPEPDEGRVLGAGILDAYSTQFPEIAAIYIGTTWVCQGSLITNMSILTSASCLFDSESLDFAEEEDITVAVGITKLSKGDPKNRLKVAKMDIHPKARLYITMLNFEYDVALLTLNKPIAMDGNYVNTINLPAKTSKNDDFVTATGVVASWGTNEKGLQSDALKFITVPIMKEADCKLEHAAYRPSFEITTATICTDVSAKKSYCLYDYGAGLRAQDPKTNDPYLLGVASLNTECPAIRSNIYTRVSAILDWIAEVGP